MPNKLELTQQLLPRLVDAFRPTVDTAMKEWWVNPKQDAGLRLTTSGYFVFNLLKIPNHVFEVPPGLPALPRQLLILDRKLTCPYYITLGKKPTLALFGDQEATMFALYGNIEKFFSYLSRT